MPSELAMKTARSIYVQNNGERFANEWPAVNEQVGNAKLIDAALAEREAQARAEEREKVARLVSALKVLSDSHTRDDDTAGYVVEMGSMPPPYIDQSRYVEAWGEVRQFIATYNDNRKG